MGAKERAWVGTTVCAGNFGGCDDHRCHQCDCIDLEPVKSPCEGDALSCQTPQRCWVHCWSCQGIQQRNDRFSTKRFQGTLGAESGGFSTLGDGVLVACLVGVLNCCGGWKDSLSLVMALLTGVPWFRKGVVRFGFFMSFSQMRSSAAAVSFSLLDVSGIWNLVGGNMLVTVGKLEGCLCLCWW